MINVKGRVFEYYCDKVDVTSVCRPDTGWKFVDPANHTHVWFNGDQPATGYQPGLSYTVPTIKWVKDGVGYFEDGEEYGIGHYECKECGFHVKPGNTADTHRQYMPGLKHFTIDGETVSEPEFMRQLEEAQNGEQGEGKVGGEGEDRKEEPGRPDGA